MTKLVIDISYYQYFSDTQWKLLSENIDGVIIRTSYGVTEDSKAKDHFEKARNYGLPVSAYHWCDPLKSIGSQKNFIEKMVGKHKPASMFLDFEQYWTDWDAYMCGDYTEAYRTKFSQTALNTYYKDLLYNLECGLLGTYSANWFIDGYAPGMRSWINDTNYWEALYLNYTTPTWWNQKQAELGKDFHISKMREIVDSIEIPNDKARQFISYAEVQGLSANIRYHLDWNSFTDEFFNKMFAIAPEPPPQQIERAKFIGSRKQIAV